MAKEGQGRSIIVERPTTSPGLVSKLIRTNKRRRGGRAAGRWQAEWAGGVALRANYLPTV